MIPPKEIFEYDRMKPSERAESLEWYDRHTAVFYDFQTELREYCTSDVDIPKEVSQGQ